MNLDEYRKEIDAIDSELMRLFEKRMEIVVNVAKYKKENNLDIFQPKREVEVIKKNIEKIHNENLKEYASEFLNELMRVSKAYQEEKIGD